MTDWNAQSDKVVDNPFGIDQVNVLNDNTKAVREQALRCGISGGNVRLAMARGTFSFSQSVTSAGAEITQVVSFATNCTDGDPSFSATPVAVAIQCVEDSSGAGADWGSATFIHSTYITSGTLSSSGMTVGIFVFPVSGVTNTFAGDCYWTVFGAPTAGE